MVTATHRQTAQVTIETVGPEQAATYLANMAPNRNLNTGRVHDFVVMMQSGEWIFDGAPIRFDITGRLVDGQNRLTALIQADLALPFTIIRGLPPEAMAVMDTGKSRTSADILKMAYPDMTNVFQKAAATRGLYLWDHGYRGNTLVRLGNVTVPHQRLLDFYRDNQEHIDETVLQAGRIGYRLRGFSKVSLTIAVWVFTQIDAEDAAAFFDRLGDGVGLAPGSPILAVRKRATEVDRVNGRQTLPTDEGLALLIKAWNAYRDGRELKVLLWRRGGANPEQFPEPK